MGVVYHSNNETYGYNFIPAQYIPNGKDEYYLRNEQVEHKDWVHLTDCQIEVLEKNGNVCEKWEDVLVTKTFNPNAIKNSHFLGLVRLGDVASGHLQYHDFSAFEGITNSTIISCDIGNHCAIHNCTYVSNYIIGDMVILSNVDEISATNHCKAGNGIIKDGESEDVRIWIDPLNEAGGRSVLPFYDMNSSDAYLWTVYRDEPDFMQALFDITQKSYDSRRGLYATIGTNAVVKNSQTIKDTNIGAFAYIKGANKIKNVSIKSDEEEPTQIGEGVELVNGIIGFGCHIFYGCKAVRFVIGNNSSLKYGARLIHSILGDNSTVSCCEVLNNLVFPFHEQHHNNSFLIASMVMGQSNMAAGATVGSNHNSRGNDGEIIAGRGFWPGLSATLKHNSKFASFVLIAKGNYQNEMNIPLPFSMVVQNSKTHCVEVMPAYFWMYNMYALERNSWKFKTRDKRKHIEQFIVTEYMAPDTVSEILSALELLELWTGKAVCDALDNSILEDEVAIRELGKKYLNEKPEFVREITVFGKNMERSKNPVRIIKIVEAYAAYKQMLLFYSVKTIANYLKNNAMSFIDFAKQKTDDSIFEWVNVGGQLIPAKKLEILRKDIVQEKYASWKEIHAQYRVLWNDYEFDNCLCALHVMRFLTGSKEISANIWNAYIDKSIEIRAFIEEQIYKTKLKDYTNDFRSITYRNEEERLAILGTVESNSFVKSGKKDTAELITLLNGVRA